MAYAAVTAAVTLGADTTKGTPFSVAVAVNNYSNSSTVASRVSKIDLFFTTPNVVGSLDNPQVGGVVAGVGNVDETNRTTSSTPAISDGVAWTDTQATVHLDPPDFALVIEGDTLPTGSTGVLTYTSSGVIHAAGTYVVGARVTLRRADTGVEVQCIASTDTVVIT